MRNWKMAKQKLEIIWWKVDSSILHQSRIYLIFFHQLSPLKFNVNVFIHPFSKHGTLLFLCFFGIGTNMGKTANLFRTLISLPGSVAMPSFQSRALIMSNSAPWEGQSLGGVSVIPTPLKSPTCKEKHTSAQSHSQTDPADTVRDWSWGRGVSYAVTGACVCLDPQTASNSHPQFPTRTCKQHWPTSPLGGDCVAACRRHRALRSQTKQSIIMLFYWTGNEEIHAQMAPLRWTFITIIDKKEERCLNCDLTT